MDTLGKAQCRSQCRSHNPLECKECLRKELSDTDRACALSALSSFYRLSQDRCTGAGQNLHLGSFFFKESL